MKNGVLKVVVSGLVLMGLTGCDGVPKSFRGEFADQKSGMSLKLKRTKGVFTDSSGRKVETKTEDFKFENLLGGGNGIYLHPHPTQSELMEVFWMLPDAATRQEAGGLVWFEAEIIYSLFDTQQKKKVAALEFTHCTRGSLLLDPATKSFQAGCGADAEAITAARVK